MVLILIVAGVVLFVLGVSFIFRGSLTIPSAKEFVPLPEHEALQRSAGELDRSLQQMTDQLDTTKKQLQEAQQELTELKSAPGNEQRVKQLEQELEVARRKADAQAKEAGEIIAALKKEKDSGADLEPLRAENQRLKEQKDEFLGRLRQVESELNILQVKQQQQLDEVESRAKQNIERAAEENRKLQTQLQEKTGRIQELQGIVAALEKEKAQRGSQDEETVGGLKTTLQMLQSQLEERAIKISQLEGKLTSLQDEMHTRLNEAHVRLQETHIKLQELQNEKASWDQTRISLEDKLRKVKEFNGHLLEKDRMIQYELAKSRAQAMGFEKINEDFKTQLDEMYRTVESLRKQ